MPEIRYYDVECVPLNSSENNVSQNKPTFIARIIVTINGRKQYAIDSNGDAVALTDDDDAEFTRSILRCLDVKWTLCAVDSNPIYVYPKDPNNPFRIQITDTYNGEHCLSVSVYHKYKVAGNYNENPNNDTPNDEWEIERGDVLFSLTGLQLMVNAVASETFAETEINSFLNDVNSSHLHPYIRMLGKKCTYKSDSKTKLRKPIAAN